MPTVEENSAAPVVVTADAREPAVAVVLLNRPDRRNALTRELKDALRDAVAAVAEDTAVRAVVLAAAGRSFCVGQDLVEHAEALRRDPAAAFDTVKEHYDPIVRALATMPKPVVAAVGGAAVGAGLGLALACDLRVAADTATFATAFAAIGLTADSGLSATLVRAVGHARATELMVLGEPLDAATARAWGLVTRVVPAAETLDAALALARRLARGPTRAYAEIKGALAAGAVSSLGAALDAEDAAQARLGRTADHGGAVAAFLAKQRPVFEGR